jgi:hypothetical protein
MSTLVLILNYTVLVLLAGYGTQRCWHLRGDLRGARAFTKEVRSHTCSGGWDCPVHAMDEAMANSVRRVRADLVLHVVLTAVVVVAVVMGAVLLAGRV